MVRPLAVLAFLALLVLPAAEHYDPASAGDRRAGVPGLDSRLQSVEDAFRAGGTGAARQEARKLGLDATDDDVRVIVKFRDGQRADMPAAVAGGEESAFRNLVQASVPFGELEALSEAPGVVQVRPPLEPIPYVTSQGVGLSNADDWHLQGLTGAGVKVAVLDLGFQGYASRLGTELPASVTAMSFRADADITGGGIPHGTAVAEVVHDMAPEAQLYLVNFDTEVELANAAAWLDSQGVQVVNASWGYFVSGPGDGTGIVNDVVSASVANGAFWSIAAANHAQKHWSGLFADSDGDSFHEYSGPLDEGNLLFGSLFGTMLAGEQMTVELKWNDPWGSACRDYDLYILRTVGQGTQIVGASENVQNDGVDCVTGAEPWESISIAAPVTDEYYVVVSEFASTSDAFLHLYSYGHDYLKSVAAGSLGQPADNAAGLTVGAVNWATPGTIESFSSRGPTDDGRTKPDLVASDGVANATYGAFSGTSASSPHLAGAAALVLQRSPCLEPVALKSLLAASTVDLGAPGADNTFGAGRLLLGTPPTDSDGDGPSDNCDNCPEWPNAGQHLPPWPVPAEDADCDGFAAAIETHVGTIAVDHCNDTPDPNDEADAWPTDFNDTMVTNLSDVILMGPSYNKSQDEEGYGQRFDLNGSSSVTLADVVSIGPFYNKGCG
jgi:subtilisin family serine protease